VGVPGGSRAGFEGDDGASDARGFDHNRSMRDIGTIFA
jgi:hypothetical protein